MAAIDQSRGFITQRARPSKLPACAATGRPDYQASKDSSVLKSRHWHSDAAAAAVGQARQALSKQPALHRTELGLAVELMRRPFARPRSLRVRAVATLVQGQCSLPAQRRTAAPASNRYGSLIDNTGCRRFGTSASPLWTCTRRCSTPPSPVSGRRPPLGLGAAGAAARRRTSLAWMAVT